MIYGRQRGAEGEASIAALIVAVLLFPSSTVLYYCTYVPDR